MNAAWKLFIKLQLFHNLKSSLAAMRQMTYLRGVIAPVNASGSQRLLYKIRKKGK